MHDLAEVPNLLAEIQLRLDQIGARVAEAMGATSPVPRLTPSELARVNAVGEVAFRHLRFIQEHGSMTLGDSLEIRRELYGDKVRATANLFGKVGSGAPFYRTAKYGTPRRDDQEVKLTAEGERMAELWRLLHPGP